MKLRFTYKEFTLVAGILVALIIMLTLWLQPVSTESGDISGKLIPSVSKPSASIVIDKAIVVLENFLR